MNICSRRRKQPRVVKNWNFSKKTKKKWKKYI